jgi:hypothetical protein
LGSFLQELATGDGKAGVHGAMMMGDT